MDFQIYFCADGILRAKFSEDKPMIPVKFLQDNSQFKDNDLRFWTRWWETTVYFEEGLTVSKFLFCLEPWADFWADITCKDIKAYIKEVRKPLVVNIDENDVKLDWVGLIYHTEVEANVEYHKSDDRKLERNFEKWINSKKNVRLTGKWNIHSSYRITGFVKGEQEQYSVDYTPLNKLANIPLVLNNEQWIYFNDWQMKRILDENEEHVFKENAFGVCNISGKIKFLIGDKYHKMKDVVDGFFWWMDVNPIKREEFIEDLRLKKEESLRDNKSSTEEDMDNNVINLFNKDTSIENEEKKLEVKFASGAFDSLIQGFERDKHYWEEMLQLASNQDNVILKIGKVELNKIPEKRIFGYIVDPADDKANPQCSKYRKI